MAISYVEIPNLIHNTEAILEVIKFIYDHLIYGELNTKCDYCHECGFDGEMKIVKDNDDYKLYTGDDCISISSNSFEIIGKVIGLLKSFK